MNKGVSGSASTHYFLITHIHFDKACVVMFLVSVVSLSVDMQFKT
jgi:hypothetical protein